MYQSEALWIGMDCPFWKPTAVIVLAGSVNVVSGGVNDDDLSADPQNYVVCPKQPWLDGFNTGSGVVRQFVATPLGSRRTVEEQLSTAKPIGGIRIIVYDPRPNIFSDKPPTVDEELPRTARSMGLGAGGFVRQKIYPDPFGFEVWDKQTRTEVGVRILNTAEFRAITGRAALPPMMTAKQYADAGLPWFEWYDEHESDVPASPTLGRLKSAAEPSFEDEKLSPDNLRIQPLGGQNRSASREEKNDEPR